ncbi:hypothetical protein [Aquimarina sp. MAR_2010_214]|uniref:hypothetical protein n=1 Tax=Aquimarina sp. MAR_2010_214 TaxID=1250026 RepID=UPI0011784EB3|nr:hypothetical protein [Aquimarina sp. MAR_2010_214]
MSMITIIGYSQSLIDKYKGKTNTIDNVINTLYAVISGEKGEERDWKLMRYINTPAYSYATSSTP